MTVLHSSTRRSSAASPLFFAQPWSRFFPSPLPSRFTRCLLSTCFFLLFHFVSLSFSSCIPSSRARLWKPYKSHAAESYAAFGFTARTNSRQSYSPGHVPMVLAPSSWSEKHSTPKALLFWWHGRSDTLVSVPSFPVFSTTPCTERPVDSDLEATTLTTRIEDTTAGGRRQSGIATEKATLVVSDNRSQSSAPLPSRAHRRSQVASLRVSGPDFLEFYTTSSCKRETFRSPCCGCRPSARSVRVPWLNQPGYLWSIRARSLPHDLDTGVGLRGRTRPLVFIVSKCTFQRCSRHRFCCLQRASCLPQKGVHKLDKQAGSGLMLGTPSDHSSERIRRHADWIRDKIGRIDATEDRCGSCGTHSRVSSLPVYPSGPSEDGESAGESTEEDAQEGPFYLSRQFNHSTWERWIYTWWEKHLRLFEPDTAARHVAGEDTLFFGRRLPLSDRERRERVPKKRCLPREENTSHAASEANKGQSMKYSLHGGENVSSTGMRGEIWRDSDEHRLSLSGGSSSGLRSSESRQDKDKLRAFDPVKEAPSFRLLMPPPNVTGALHLGHAASLSIQDLIVRFRRMLMVARGRYFQSTKGRTVKRARYDTEEVEDGTGNTRWNEKVAWTVPGERYDDKEEVKHQARNCYGPCKVEQRRESKKASAAPLLRKGREIGSELAQRSLPESHCCRDSDEQGEEQQYTETDERDTSPDNEGFFDSSAPRPRRRFKRDSVEACRTEWIPGFDHAGLGMEWLFQKHALRVQERKKRRMQELLQERLCRQSSFSREKDKSGMDFSMKDVPLDLCDSATSSACESDCPPHMRRRPVSAGAQKGGSAQVEARDEQVKGTTARSDEETKRASVVQRWVSLCQRVIATQQRRLGCSCNWTRSVYTLDKAYRSLVENAFIELYRRGFIRRGSYLTLWDTGARTALADFEVIYPPPETLRLVACRRINTKKQVTKEAVRGKGGVYFSEGGELYADARAPNFMKRRIESVNNVQKATSSSLLHGAESSSEQINKDKQTLYFLSCELVRGSPSSTQPWPALCGQILSSEREARAQKEAEAEIAEEATTLPFSGPAHLFSEFEAHGTRGSAKISAGENCEEIRRGEEGRQGVVAAGRQESWMGKDNEGHRKERFRVAFALNDLRQLFGIAAICLKPRAFDRLTSAAAFISSSPRTSSSYLSSGTPALSCPMPASLGSPFRSPFSCGVSPEDSWFVLLPLVNRLVPVLVHEGEHLHPLAAATAVHLQKLQQAQAFTENELPSVCLLPSPDSSPVALLPNPGTLEGDSPLPGPLADGQSQTDGTVRGTYSRLRTGNVAAVGFAAFQEKGDEISWFSSSKEFEECEFDLVKRQSPAPETLSNLNKNGALDPPVEKTSASLPQRTKKMGEDGDGLISTRGTGNGETSVNEWLWSRVQEHGAAIGRVHMDGEDSAVLHPSCARYCGKSRKGAKELEGGYKEGEEESSCGLGKEEWTTVGVSEKTAKETDATLTWPRWISHRTGAEVQVRVSRQWLLDLPALSAKALEASLGERNKSFLNAKGEDKPQHSDTWVQQTPGQNAFPGPECQNAKKGTASIKGERPSSSVGQKGERRTGHSSFFTQEVLDSQRSKKVRMSFITEDCREHQKSRHEEKGDSVLFSKDQDALMLSGLRLLPDRYERQWMKALRPSNLRPWCVSRQLWWGQRLPVWEVKVAGGMKFLRDFTRRILTKETSTYHTKEEQAGGSPFSKTKSSSGTLIATDEKRERAGNEERESSFSHTGAGEDFKQGPYGTDVVGTGAFSRRGCLHPSTEIPGLKLRLLNAGDFDRSETPGESNEGEEQDEEWIEVAVTQEEALKAAKERLVKAWRSVGVQDPEAALDLLLRHSSPKHRDIEDNSDRGVDTLSQTKSNRQKGEEGAESDGIWHLGDEGDESREGKDQGKEGRRKEVSRPCGRRWRDGSSGAVGLEEEPRIAAEHELFKLERTKEVLDTWFSSALWATACAARASASSSASEEETRERTPPGRTEGLTGANTLLEMEPGQRQVPRPTAKAIDGGEKAKDHIGGIAGRGGERWKTDYTTEPKGQCDVHSVSEGVERHDIGNIHETELPLPWVATTSSSSFPSFSSSVSASSLDPSSVLLSPDPSSLPSATLSSAPQESSYPLDRPRPAFLALPRVETELVTGEDILFFWVLRQTLLSVELTDRLPFSRLVLHGLLVDSKGQKLSKTKGNAESGLLNRLIEQYGADALRWGLLSPMSPGTPLVFDEANVVKARRFVHKLWNIGRYIAAFCGINPEALRQDVKEKWGNQENTREETPDSESLVLDEDSPHSDHLFEIKEEEKFGSPALEKREPLIVRYILSRMKEVAYTVTRLLFDKSDVGGAARLLQAFLWHDVADWLLPAATAMKKKKACILHELSPQRQSRNGTVADDQQDTNEAAETQRDHEEDPVRSQNHVRCNQAEMNQLSKSEDSAYLSSVERKKRSTIVTKEREGRGEQGRRSFLDISSRLEECSNCVHHWALVLLRVFDLSLRLLHPFLPFVSEALFQLVVLPWIARPHEKTVKAPSYSCASSNAMDRKEPVGIPSSQDKKKKTEDDAAEVTRKWTEIQGGEKYDSAAHQKLSQSLKAQEEGKKEKEEEDLNSGRQGSWQIENMTSRQGRADSEQDGSLVDTPSRREELGNEREKMKRRRRPPFSLLEDTEERIRRILFGNIHSESPRALMASRWPLHATEIPSTDAYALKAFKIFQNVVRRIRGAIKKFSQNASLVSSSDALRGRNRLSYVSRSTAEEEERKGGTSEKKKETDENSREGERKKDCLYVILRTSNRKLFNLLEEEKFFVANLSGVDPDNLRLEFDSPLQHSFPRENMDFVLNTDKKKQRESLSIEPEVTTEDKEETMQKEKRIEETDMKQDEEDDDTFPDLDIHVSSSAKGYPFLPSTEGEEIDSEGKKPDGEVPSRSQNGRHGAAELLTDKKDEEKEKEEEGMELLYSADDDSVKTKEAQSQSSLKQKTRRLRKAENVKQKIESLQERLTAPLFALRAPVDVQAKLKSRLKRLRREYEELLIDHDDG